MSNSNNKIDFGLFAAIFMAIFGLFYALFSAQKRRTAISDLSSFLRDESKRGKSQEELIQYCIADASQQFGRSLTASEKEEIRAVVIKELQKNSEEDNRETVAKK